MNDRVDISQFLRQAMEKYGEFALAVSDKTGSFNKGVETESLNCRDISYQKLKEAALKSGNLLEADSKKQLIVVSVPVGAMKASHALLVARLEESRIDIGAYFKEGLIKQRGAREAIECISHQLQL